MENVYDEPVEIAQEIHQTKQGSAVTQFQKGASGNPKGRPKGSKNRMKALAEGLIGTNASKIVKKVISMALDGNEACLKMCMDRIIPAQRAIDQDANDKGKQVININVESMKGLPQIQVSEANPALEGVFESNENEAQ